MTAAVASVPLTSTSTTATMATSGTEASSTAQSGGGNKESKLRQSILNAYLEPLLKKHGLQQDITFEDLMTSKKAADHIIENDGSNDRKSSLKEELELLHRTQLKAYMEAAERALRSWIHQQVEAFASKNKASGAGNEKDKADEQEQCVTHVLSMSGTKPNYRVGPNFWKQMVQEAVQHYYKSSAASNKDNPVNTTSTVDTEEGEIDGTSAQDHPEEQTLETEEMETEDGLASKEDVNIRDPATLGISKDDVIQEEPNEDEEEAEEGEVEDGHEEMEGDEDEEEDGQLEDDGGTDGNDEGKEDDGEEEVMEEDEDGKRTKGGDNEGTDKKGQEDTAGDKTTASSDNKRLKNTRRGGKLGQVRKQNTSGNSNKSGNKVGGAVKKVVAVGRRKVPVKSSVGGARNNNTVKAKGSSIPKATTGTRRSTRTANK